jgi:hypothetical protein
VKPQRGLVKGVINPVPVPQQKNIGGGRVSLVQVGPEHVLNVGLNAPLTGKNLEEDKDNPSLTLL